MSTVRTATLACLIAGLLLVVVPPWLPGGERLTLHDPPREGHVMALAATADGILAGTQQGELWRYRDGAWALREEDRYRRPVTVLRGDPAEIPAGTAAGLWPEPDEPIPGSPRISDVLGVGDVLVIATGDGVLRNEGGSWHRDGPAVQAYRLARQDRDGRTLIHVGTIDDGVWSRDLRQPDGLAQNNAGLPSPVNVLSLTTTAGGILLAGTDGGLYWQLQPGTDWRRIDAGLGGRRILSLFAAPEQDGIQRLWIGSDDGLRALDLVERTGSLESRGRARHFETLGEGPRSGVSWILLDQGKVVISAGAVYRLERVRFLYWHWFTAVGAALLVAGLWLRHRSAHPRH